MKTILIFDLADTLVEGFARFVETLSPRLNVLGTEVLSGLGGEPLVALMEGRSTETTYWQQVLAKTHWPLSVETLMLVVK